MIRAVPSTWRLGRLVRRLFASDPATYEAAGSEAGVRFATQPWGDDQIGSTAPAGVGVIEARAVGDLAVMAASFERDRGRWRQRLRRRGATLEVRRTRLRLLVADEPRHVEPVEPGDTRRVALFWWAWLVGLCAASAGLDAVVLEVLGMDLVTTWAIASIAGIAQVVALVDVGGRVRDRHDEVGHSGEWILVAVGLGAALAFGVTAATMRTARMVSAAAIVHLAAPSFLLGVLTFSALALVIDGVALLLGYRLAGRGVRAQLVRARKRNTYARLARRAEHRLERSRGRFLAAAERARSQVELAAEAITLSLARHQASVAAFYDAACGGADAMTGAALADQLDNRRPLAEAERAIWEQRISAARSELLDLVASHGEELVTTSLLAADVHVVKDGEEAEDVGEVRAA